MVQTAILDVDGTLVDTNYHHTLAWQRAFRRHGVDVPAWRIHRHVGMGGDRLVAAVAGEEVEDRYGDELRSAWAGEYEPLLAEVQPLPGARELLAAVRRRGLTLVLASSGPPEHVERYLHQLDARRLAAAWTSSADVQHTKPAPDLVQVALRRAGGGRAAMVGDSTWDCEAARRAGLPVLAVLSGGIGAAELTAAGAAAVFESPADLADRLDATPLAGPDAG